MKRHLSDLSSFHGKKSYISRDTYSTTPEFKCDTRAVDSTTHVTTCVTWINSQISKLEVQLEADCG